MPQSLDQIASVTPWSGALLIRNLLDCGLFGILLTLVYLYYVAFPNDKLHVKCLVYGIFVLQTVQFILILHDSFLHFGVHFGDLLALESSQTEWFSVPVLGGIVGCAVQVFYAIRIRILSRKRFVPIVIAILAFVQCAGSIIGGVAYKTRKTITDAELSFQMRVAVGLRDGGSTLCDVLIAGYMWHYLSRRKEGIIRRTEKLVSRIIRLCIVTGTITALVAVIELVLYFGIGQGYYLVPGTLLGNLYSNSVMVMLNSRMEINGGRNSDVEMSTDANFTFRIQITSTTQEMVSPSIGVNAAPYLQNKNDMC